MLWETSVTVKHLIKKASSAMPNFTKSASELFDCYSLQLVCHNVLFTLLNIKDNSVVIIKLRQDKSRQALKESVSADSEVPDIMFVCSMVDYGIHTYIEAVRYIFISNLSLECRPSMFQISFHTPMCR